ncbi:MAG: M42 family peptidase, partial [Chloroflexi bacterium]|nr:M42 family peptidase [Chloroflexota bacterium]
MKPLIKKLVETYGPSGSESQIRDLVRAEIRNLPDYITVDALGNLMAVIKKNSKSGKKVMLSAHMDEIGVIVSHVDDKGFA